MQIQGERLLLKRTGREDPAILRAVSRGFSIQQSFLDGLPPEGRELAKTLDEVEAYEEADVPDLSFSRDEAALIEGALRTAMEHQRGFGGRGMIPDPRAIGSMEELSVNPAYIEDALPIVAEFAAAA